MESTNTTADTTLVTNLVLANKKLQSDVRKMKLWLFLSWAVFCGISLQVVMGM